MFLPGEHLLGPAVDKNSEQVGTGWQMSNRTKTAKLLVPFSSFTSKQIRKAYESLGGIVQLTAEGL